MISPPQDRRIVLIGGGHAHVGVLDAFRRRPPAAQVILVARDLLTPYSGLIPGVVAGAYAPQDAHIDLARLASACGVAIVHGEAEGVDRAGRQVRLRDGSRLTYDVLSIDVGVTTALDAIEGAAEFAIAIKPIGTFLAKVEKLLHEIEASDRPQRVVMVGGGAAGVEVLLALQERVQTMAAGQAGQIRFSLVTAGELLAGHNARVRAAFRRILTERSISLREGVRVTRISGDTVELESAPAEQADFVLVSTNARAPDWLANTGLPTNPGGFLRVLPTLQAEGDPDVFAAGDCADLVATPREKAGVYAVRAGPPLAENLRRRVEGRATEPWTPQARHLSLITAGANYAVASRGVFKLEGEWVWWLKRWIDRRWMDQYRI